MKVMPLGLKVGDGLRDIGHGQELLLKGFYRSCPSSGRGYHFPLKSPATRAKKLCPATLRRQKSGVAQPVPGRWATVPGGNRLLRNHIPPDPPKLPAQQGRQTGPLCSHLTIRLQAHGSSPSAPSPCCTPDTGRSRQHPCGQKRASLYTGATCLQTGVQKPSNRSFPQWEIHRFGTIS
jgi:hypothetical protein